MLKKLFAWSEAWWSSQAALRGAPLHPFWVSSSCEDWALEERQIFVPQTIEETILAGAN
jgi:hypothetical protein